MRLLRLLTDTLAAVDVLEEAGLAGQCGGAVFAGVAPGLADGGTAQLLSADDPGQLRLAHVVVDLRETRPSPVVWWRTVEGGRQQRAGTQTTLVKPFINVI